MFPNQQTEEQKFQECRKAGHELDITPEACGDGIFGSWDCKTCGASGSGLNDVLVPVMNEQIRGRVKTLRSKLTARFG